MPSAVERRFTRRLREERERAGISQAAIAEYLTEQLEHRVDASALSRMEKGVRAVRLDEAVAIADILGVELEALLRDRDSVDDEIDELQRDLALDEHRAAQARHEAEQAMASAEAARRRIAELEAARAR